jgi:hypothetical protein
MGNVQNCDRYKNVSLKKGYVKYEVMKDPATYPSVHT